MASLYEMTSAAKKLYELLEAEEVDEGTVKDTLDAIGTEEKLISYVHVIKEMQSDIEKFKAEEDRLHDRRKTIENGIDRMKSAIKEYMQATGTEKTEAGTFKLRINHSKSVNVWDASRIPEEFREPQPDKILKTDIKKAIASGKEVDGAEITENTSVVIR